jgi:hypothetical protein
MADDRLTPPFVRGHDHAPGDGGPVRTRSRCPRWDGGWEPEALEAALRAALAG